MLFRDRGLEVNKKEGIIRVNHDYYYPDLIEIPEDDEYKGVKEMASDVDLEIFKTFVGKNQ